MSLLYPKMKYFLSLCTLTCGLLLFVAPAFGQSNEREQGMPFTCLQWGKLPYEEIFYRNGSEAIPLELYDGRRSQTYFLNVQGVLELYLKPGADGSDNLEPVLVGRTTYDPANKRMLFILKAAPEGSNLPIGILPIEDSVETFPAGTFRFANFSPEPLTVEIGDTKDRLTPNSIEVFRPKTSPKGGLISMIVYDATGKTVFGRRIFGQPRDRKMVIFTNSGQLGCRFLFDPDNVFTLPGHVEPVTCD